MTFLLMIQYIASFFFTWQEAVTVIFQIKSHSDRLRTGKQTVRRSCWTVSQRDVKIIKTIQAPFKTLKGTSQERALFEGGRWFCCFVGRIVTEEAASPVLIDVVGGPAAPGPTPSPLPGALPQPGIC